jgi:DNA-binding transcriptional LysR family regulator
MSRPLDPISLQHFVTVCEEGNLARAAARESLVASALSKRMAQLEADLGVSLLIRRRRGVELTAAGEALLVRAREVLSALARVRAELSEHGQGVQGHVRVWASPSALAEHLPDDVAAFMAQEPGIRIGLDERLSPEIVRGVREGEADVGVLWDHINDLSGLKVLPYRQDHLAVVMALDHPLAQCPSLRFQDTLDADWISVLPGGQMDQLLRRQAALLGRQLSFRMQVSAMDAACRMVGAGLGLSILPLEAAEPYVEAGRLASVPLQEPWALRRFVLISRPEPLISLAGRLLAAHLHAQA